MLQKRKVAFHWSGGKDSALGLSLLLAREDVQIDRLVTTVDGLANKSTVHEIPVELLVAQARRLGIRLQTIPLPGPDLDGYVESMQEAATSMREEGIEACAFGDLTHSGLQDHRKAQFASLGMDVLEPLAGLSSRECIEAFLGSGFRAITVVVDAAVLGPGDVGVPLDRAFIEWLPAGADPCGEFGEYHSYVFDGPCFTSPVDFAMSPRRRVEREINTTEGLRHYAYWLSTPCSGTEDESGDLSGRPSRS